ncbi:MAG: hypothetical protein Q7T29_04240 [Gallionella sp.]|nr:hypothetical protein [Gallionella sp.]
MARPYFSVRTGRSSGNVVLDLAMLRDVFRSEIESLEERGYLQEAFGKWCPDADDGLIPGTLGRDIEVKILVVLRKRNLWPVRNNYQNYSEDDVFDMIEYIYDHTSKPLSNAGFFHSYGGCGWHYDKFTRAEAQSEFRATMNEVLRDYAGGYELTQEGEVALLLPEGVNQLIETPLPINNDTVQTRLTSAISQYRRRGSTLNERRIAVRELADILEHLKPTAVSLLNKKDESDLFNIINNFGIRHANEKQKTNYDTNIWLSWMFHFLLATIHACVRLEEKVSSPGKA